MSNGRYSVRNVGEGEKRKPAESAIFFEKIRDSKWQQETRDGINDSYLIIFKLKSSRSGRIFETVKRDSLRAAQIRIWQKRVKTLDLVRSETHRLFHLELRKATARFFFFSFARGSPIPLVHASVCSRSPTKKIHTTCLFWYLSRTEEISQSSDTRARCARRARSERE